MTTKSTKLFKGALLMIVGILISVSLQAQRIEIPATNDLGIPQGTWVSYINKTNVLLENVDEGSFINYILFHNDGNFSNRQYFVDFIHDYLVKSKQQLILKVGKGEITTVEGVNSFLAGLQPQYEIYYQDFMKRRNDIIADYNRRAPGAGGTPTPFNCGSPCTNPGFESGTGFWDYWTGNACASSTQDPCSLVAGYSATQTPLQTVGGFDPLVGAALPVVPPGGGSYSLMLGDGPITGGYAARASISFTVSATNANFTYRYAVVLQDPNSSPHTDPERPYFNVRLRDASGNVVPCGDYAVMAKPPITGFTAVPGVADVYYRPWTSVFVPLSSYIGQCVTIQFTASDCSQGGHYGYAYIDGDCDPLTLLTSSPAVCGGTAVTLTAPAGGAAYAWSNTAGGTTGIVGATTNQTATVNQGGTYQCVITSVSGAACTTTLNITVGSSPSNPVAAFTNTTVCAGNATAFTDASTPAGSISTWDWDFDNDGVTDSNVQNPTHVFPAAGTYPVTLNITWGPCNATITQNVTVTAGPVLVVTNPPAVCSPGTVDITAASVTAGSTGGGTLSYWNDAAATSAMASPSAVATSGTYYIKVTNGGCSDIKPVVVTINPLPVSDAGPDVTICSGTAASIGTATTAGNSYSWSPTTGLSSSSISNPSITTVNSGTSPIVTTYTVTTTVTATGCSSTDPVIVTVNPQPALVITNPPAVCSPGTVDITAASVTAGSTGGGTLSYWNDAGATSALASPGAVSSSGTYYIKVINSGCSDIKPVVVTINPLPVSDAGPDVTICTGSTATLGTASVAGNTYAWLPSTGLTATNVSNPTFNLTNAGSTPIATTYTVTTTVTATGCSSTDQVIATVNPLATADAGPAQTICAGQTVALAGTIGGSATSGTWGGGGGTYSPSNNDLNAVYTPSAGEISAGSVTLTLVSNDPAGPCPVATSTMTITINPVATVNAGPDQTICIGTTATLAGSIGGAATSGTWSGGAGTYAPSSTTANAVYTPTAAEEAAGSVSLIFTTDDPAGPCSLVADTMVLIINQLPVADAGLDQTICNGSTATLSGSVSGSATSGTWSGGTGSFAPSATALNAVYTPSAAENAAGTVTLTLTTNDPAGPCAAVTDQMIITINPVATINAGPDQTICIGTTATLAATLGGSASSGTWTGGTGTFAPSNLDPNAVYTPSAAENAAGTVTLTYTSDDPVGPCPSVSDNMVITINQLPTANAGATQNACIGASITLNGSVGGSATSGSWSGGSGTYVPNNAALNAVYTPSAAEYAAGYVQLLLTTDDPAGPCSYDTSSVIFHFYPTPTVNFTVDVPAGCPVHCVNFTDNSTVTGGATIVGWNWNYEDGGSDNTQNPSHCFSNTGFYDVSLTVTTSQGCVTTATVPDMVQVYAMPNAEFNPTPNPATVLDPVVTLNNASSSDVVNWFWDFGDGTSLPDSLTPSPVHSYPNDFSSSYMANLIVMNADGCWDTVAHEIFIGPEFTFFIPNAFTPNGDGINDYFFGDGIGIVDYDMYIFDRWGNMIFHGSYLYDKWDGRANNGSDVAQQDVYVWKVKLTDVFGKKHSYIGTVTLVK